MRVRLWSNPARGFPLPLGSISPKNMPPPFAPAEVRRRFQSGRAASLNESVIREMSRLAIQHKAVNLAQGFPDFPASSILKDAAREAIESDHNQYSITWGAKPFRDAIAAKYARQYGLEIDPEREITVCCGATQKLVSLRPPDWTFDPDELRRAFTSRTKAIIVNSPNNPTGKVFSR